MAHYAYIDENNIVTAVIVGPHEGTEPEGIDSWEAYFSAKGKGRAIRTSYNGNIRKNYAGVGFTYDETRDAFVPPQPYASWVLDEETCLWEAPVAFPGGEYVWDEETVNWVRREKPFDSWTWDDTLNAWVAPIPYPADGGLYTWDEDSGDWVVVPSE